MKLKMCSVHLRSASGLKLGLKSRTTRSFSSLVRRSFVAADSHPESMSRSRSQDGDHTHIRTDCERRREIVGDAAGDAFFAGPPGPSGG